MYPGAVFVICAESPLLVAQVWRFKSEDELQNWLDQEKRKFTFRIPGYMVILYAFIFDNKLPAEEVKRTLQLMARFFSEARIEKDKSYWRKFAETKRP